MGGATKNLPDGNIPITGLSPRGRGNRWLPMADRFLTRSIPAWAGQPSALFHIASNLPVYPRVGGATRAFEGIYPQPIGLSPRGRGNRTVKTGRLHCLRSIPAWAGQPGHGGRVAIGTKVYPRVGGATGSSAAIWLTVRGLSPRGRGNRSFVKYLAQYLRSIPAWAGQPYHLDGLPTWLTVYPRVGGAT